MITKWIKPFVALTLCVILAGCPSQSTLAALTQELGNSAAAIAAIEGNPQLAQKLQTDTTAAVNAIKVWKQGTPAQNVVQALNIVTADLNLICGSIPNCGPYEPLIALALATAASIIEIVDPNSTPPSLSRRTTFNAAPKNKAEYDKLWNTIVDSNSQLAGLRR